MRYSSGRRRPFRSQSECGRSPAILRDAASAADARQAAFDELGKDVRGNPEALELFYKLREVMSRNSTGCRPVILRGCCQCSTRAAEREKKVSTKSG